MSNSTKKAKIFPLFFCAFFVELKEFCSFFKLQYAVPIHGYYFDFRSQLK
jgi:hypothetical protein